MPTPGRCGCWNWPSTASPPTPSSPTSAPASAPARPWHCPGPLSRRCLPSIAQSRAGRLLPGEPGLRRWRPTAPGAGAPQVRQQGRPAQRPSDCGGPASRATRPSPWRTMSDCWETGSATTCSHWPGRATPTAWCCTTSSWPNCKRGSRPAPPPGADLPAAEEPSRRTAGLRPGRSRSWGRWRWRGGWRPMACVAC